MTKAAVFTQPFLDMMNASLRELPNADFAKILEETAVATWEDGEIGPAERRAESTLNALLFSEAAQRLRVKGGAP